MDEIIVPGMTKFMPTIPGVQIMTEPQRYGPGATIIDPHAFEDVVLEEFVDVTAPWPEATPEPASAAWKGHVRDAAIAAFPGGEESSEVIPIEPPRLEERPIVEGIPTEHCPIDTEDLRNRMTVVPDITMLAGDEEQPWLEEGAEVSEDVTTGELTEMLERVDALSGLTEDTTGEPTLMDEVYDLAAAIEPEGAHDDKVEADMMAKKLFPRAEDTPTQAEIDAAHEQAEAYMRLYKIITETKEIPEPTNLEMFKWVEQNVLTSAGFLVQDTQDLLTLECFKITARHALLFRRGLSHPK
jgi:hypothetical protein